MRTDLRFIPLMASLALVVAISASPTAAASPAAKLISILAGYSRPLLVTHAPGGGRVIYIVEQTGKIKRANFRNGAWKKLGTFLDLTARVNDPTAPGNGERGLLGLAFHPDYEKSGLFYVNYTRRGGAGASGDTVIAEFRRQTAAKADSASRRVVLVVDQPAANHNGGHLAFGPDDLMYIGLGDGGNAGDPFHNGQKRTTRLGKILRIDPLRSGDRAYTVPLTNPFVGKPGLDDIWATGLRNPWRFSFDRATGDLWIGDVGQGAREEVDRSRAHASGRNAGKGRNYGWSRCEGGLKYPPSPGDPCTFGTLPVHDYAHGDGRCSVTGGYVHRGPDDPAWHGLYVAGDYCGRLFVLDRDGGVRYSSDTGKPISSFGEDARGRIFAVDLDGNVYRVRFRGPRP